MLFVLTRDDIQMKILWNSVGHYGCRLKFITLQALDIVKQAKLRGVRRGSRESIDSVHIDQHEEVR